MIAILNKLGQPCSIACLHILPNTLYSFAQMTKIQGKVLIITLVATADLEPNPNFSDPRSPCAGIPEVEDPTREFIVAAELTAAPPAALAS